MVKKYWNDDDQEALPDLVLTIEDGQAMLSSHKRDVCKLSVLVVDFDNDGGDLVNIGVELDMLASLSREVIVAETRAHVAHLTTCLLDTEDEPKEPVEPTPEDYMAVWEAMVALNDGRKYPALCEIWRKNGTCEMRSLSIPITKAICAAYNALSVDEQEDEGAFDWEYVPNYIAHLTSFAEPFPTAFKKKRKPLDALKHHVTGAIERGEGEAIVGIVDPLQEV